MQANSLPWRLLFRSAVLGLGISPKDFWELTLPEFLSFLPQGQGLSREELLSMMAAYPDE